MKSKENVPRRLPNIDLAHSEGRLVVRPPAAYKLEEFTLPLVPMTLSDRCCGITAAIWEEHHHCMGLALMLDCRNENWMLAIPRQRSARDSSGWIVVPSDFPDLPADVVVAGSFQSRLAQPYEELRDAVPACNGLHFIQEVDTEEKAVWLFVRTAESCRSAPLPEFMFDEVEATLPVVMSRLEFV